MKGVLKMKKIAKSWSLMLAVLMLVAAVPVFSVRVAADTVQSGYSGDLTWTLTDDGTLTISGTGEMVNYEGSSFYPAPGWSKYEIHKLIVENGVTSIGTYAFRDCKSLKSVTLPDSIADIRAWAFIGCSSLEEIAIPNSVTSIEEWAFSECTSLKSVVLPGSLSHIGSFAFSGCTSLSSVIIPDGVTSIYEAAFRNCTSLTSIDIPKSVNSIYKNAFSGCASLNAINVSSENTEYCSIDGVVFDKSKTELIAFPGGKAGTYRVPYGVTDIGAWSFSDSTSVSSVVMPSSVTSIKEGAFANCTTLKSVKIPDSVTSIEQYAFICCSALESIVLPDKLTNIQYRMFDGCTSLVSAVIPDSVTDIITSAFKDCTALTDVYYTGSEEEWSRVVVGDTNDALAGANIRCNFEKVTEHDWVAGEVVAPTETEDGYTVYTCYVCGETKNDDIVPALGIKADDTTVADNQNPVPPMDDNSKVFALVIMAVVACTAASLIVVRRKKTSK